MTHAEYQEQHHELANAGLAAIATLQGRGDHQDAATATTWLRARLSALWEERRAVAERETNP